MTAKPLSIDEFITQLIADKFKGQELTDEMVKDIHTDLTDRLNKYLTLRAISEVSKDDPGKIKDLHELILSNPKPEDVQAFIANHIKNPDALVATILTDFRGLYLGEK